MKNRDLKAIERHAESFLSTFPIFKHIDYYEVIYASPLIPIKGSIETSRWEMIMHTHFNDASDKRINVMIGIKFKEKRDVRESRE